MKKKYDYVVPVKLQHNQQAAIVDIDTWEVTLVETPVAKDPNVSAMEYEDYFILNTKVLDILTEMGGITRSEKGYILDMATMLKTQYNALFNTNNHIHTIPSLAKALDINEQSTTRLLAKFEEKGIVMKMSSAGKTMYAMNPFLARKRKFIHNDLKEMFTEFK